MSDNFMQQALGKFAFLPLEPAAVIAAASRHGRMWFHACVVSSLSVL
jgi:hypothetical protein